MPTFNKSCGGVLTENTGWLASPDSDNDGLYDNDEDCWWFIIAEVYQAITINITDIDIEDNVVCGYDYLMVSLIHFLTISREKQEKMWPLEEITWLFLNWFCFRYSHKYANNLCFITQL